MDDEREDRIRRILEGETEGLYPNSEEERIVRKAVPFNQRRQNLKRFVFTDLETLIDDVKQIYPAAIIITVVNNDERDANNVPRITLRTSDTLRLVVTKLNSYGKRGLERQTVAEVSAAADQVLCLVQDGYVTVKKGRLSFRGN